MIQKHRISTDIGKDQLIKVELKQDFDLLEILSLKFTQKDVYASMCSDYGVVCGRIIVNNGFGVPNARVSIFIPISDEDENDPVIKSLYPYKQFSDKNDEGYRYNLLPARKQHGGHEPTGTFPDQLDILTREEVLEVYEKYYKFTVKTNDAGDFMIWGVPVGPQYLHVDVDLSDMGCFSLRPIDFINMGAGKDEFKNTYSFKSSEDLDSLPQIVSYDRQIEVYPLWGNEDLCEIGITRTDFDLSDKGVRVEPKAYVIGGTFSDTGKNTVNKNCGVRKKQGRKCDLITKTGTIEALRFTPQKDIDGRPILEQYPIDDDISDDGAFVFAVPMNMEYVYTNEFGEREITNDPNKGIATAACYRFRFTLDDQGKDRVRKTGSYLVPNIREYSTQQDMSYEFSTNWKGYPTLAVSSDPNRGILYMVDGGYYPRDYFYRLTYNKVYTVSSFQNTYFQGSSFTKDKFIGIKEILPSEEEDCQDRNTPPVNFGFKNYTFTLLIADVVLLIEHLINLVILTLFNTLSKVLHSLADAVDFWPIRKLSKAIRRYAYRVQDAGQRKLYLITYPECEECNEDNEFGDAPSDTGTVLFCEIGTFSVLGTDNQSNRELSISTGYVQASSGCTGNTIYTIDDLWSNQSNYVLAYGTDLRIQLTGITGTGLNSIIKTYDPMTSGYTYTYYDGSENFSDNTTYDLVVIKILGSSVPSASLETGCNLYDVPYDEDLIRLYYIGTGRTQVFPSGYTINMDVTATNIIDNGYPLPTGYDGDVYAPITPSGESEFTNGKFLFIPGTQTNPRVWEILKEYRRRKRVAKLFCGGIVNYSFIDNWLSGSLYFVLFKAKKGKSCENLTRYVTSQERYYYKSAIYYNETNWGVNKVSSKFIGRPTTMVDLGPRDEFIKEICVDPSLDPNCSVTRAIGPTSFQNFGEILGFAINYRMDVSNNTFSINDFFDNAGFTITNRVFDGDLLQLISINNEAGIQEFDLQSPKYLGYSYQYLDPELQSSVFKAGNSYYGPTPITFEFDDDGERVRACLNEPGRLTESSQKVPFFLWDKKGTGFGGTTYATSDDQSWDYSSVQVQPLQGMTYGYSYTGTPNDPSDQYLLLPITYTYSGLSVTGISVTTDLEFDAIDDSVTDNHTTYDTEYPGFTYLHITSGSTTNPLAGTLWTRVGSVSGNTTYSGITISNGWHNQPWNSGIDFIIKPTIDYYTGTKQILSTPFLFYFGLINGKTGVDKFIELFGDKGAFTSAE